MKLRHSIMLYFGTFTAVFLSGILLLNYSIVQKRLYNEAHQELRRVVSSVESAANSMIDTVIRNYLRGIVELDLLLLEELNHRVDQGHLTLQEAKDAFQAYVDKQRIGQSGYMAATTPRDGSIYLDIHPFYRGLPCPDMEVCRQWMEQKTGYLTYLWMNPQDNEPRRKVSFLHYFEPWNWVIGATSYEDEFYQLVEVEDFRELVSSFVIKNNGYLFILDSDFNMLVHPELEGVNVFGLQNDAGVMVTQELISSPREFYYYDWINPATGREELKYSYMEELEVFGWYVVATGYVHEIYEPVQQLMSVSYILVGFAALGLFTLILFFSRSITYPLNSILQGLKDFYQDDREYTLDFHAVTEIESVGKAVEDMTKAVISSEENRRILLSQLDSIINSMPSMLLGINRKGEVIFINEKAQEYLGKEKESLLHEELSRVLGNFAPALPIIERSMASNSHESGNMQLENSDKLNSKKYFEITVYPLASHHEAWVVRIDDISQRIHMEDMLYHSRKMDAIGQLAGGVAHDFNNMLAGILNSLELLDPIIDPSHDARVYLDIIEEASLRASELTRKLLAFSRKSAKVSTPQDVHSGIDQTIAILNRSINKNVEIRKDLQAREKVVIGDMALLQSMFLNLGINASHAMPKGGILTFRTRNYESRSDRILHQGEVLPQGKYILVEVEDTGTGIPLELQSKIFEPFFTTKRQGDGTGLGLASVLGVVQQHEGALELWSREGQGSRFSLYLPVTDSGVVLEGDKGIFRSTQRATILLVEDEKILRKVTAGMLHDLGYASILAENGVQALELLDQHSEEIDLILLDMIMPEMGGRECLKEIRRINRDIPVIIASGFSQQRDMQQVQNLGISAFLAKPYSMATLSRIIAEAFNGDK